MHRDSRGLPISSAGSDVAEALRSFQIAFQRFDDTAASVFDLADAVTDCLAVQVYAAALHLYGQVESEIEDGARPFLDRARPLVSEATAREQLLYRAVECWSRSDFAGALRAFEELLRTWPEDVTAVKFAEFVLFQAPDYRRHLELMEQVAPANQDLPCFGAMHAFAHELNGHFDGARSLAMAAVEQELDTPWAHHALAHVYLNTNRLGEGRDMLGELLPTWQHHSAGVRAHNAWHLALLHLADGDVERTLSIHRELIAEQAPGSAFEHTDAVSLLWRVELSGHAVEQALWEPILPFAEERGDDLVFPFLNAHYLYALARSGRGMDARACIDRLAAKLGRETSPPTAWKVGIPLLQAVTAFGEEDWAEGARLLDPVLGDLACVGGSDAQNDLFVQAQIVGLTRCGRTTDARDLLRRRIGGRPPNRQEQSWLSAA